MFPIVERSFTLLFETSMVFAVLELIDYVMVGVLIAVLGGGTAAASRRLYGGAATEERLRRIEDKLNVLLNHMEIDYVPRTKERWQRLAEANSQEEAVKEYSDAHSVPNDEAERVVEQYLADARQSSGL